MKQRIFSGSSLLGLLLTVLMTGSVYAAGDAAAGKTKSATCGGCHGIDGNSLVPAFPKLAGQGEAYIVKQITDFKANTTRQNAIMLGMSAALSAQDAADIGAFYQSQKLASVAAFDASKVAMGREIYKGGNLQTGVPACQACHGPAGAGNAPAGYPQVAGQYPDYTLMQLKAFKDGSRSNDKNALMRQILTKMTDIEIEAVTQYIASIK